MIIKAICKTCGAQFDAIKQTQQYCKRRCFKRSYYLKVMEKKRMEAANPKYPMKRCSFCLQFYQLNFDPLKNPKRYNEVGCPYCNVTNNMIWQNSREQNSHQIISNIVLSGTFQLIQE